MHELLEGLASDVVPLREDLIDLIEWLSLTYAGDPVFHMDGEKTSVYKERLQRTWDAVVGHKGPPLSGVAWKPCVTCGGVGWLVALEKLCGSDLELDLLRLCFEIMEVDAEARPDHPLWLRIVGRLPALRDKWISPEAQETRKEDLL